MTWQPLAVGAEFTVREGIGRGGAMQLQNAEGTWIGVHSEERRLTLALTDTPAPIVILYAR